MGKAIVMSNERHGESDETPTESKTTGTVGNFPHGSRETPVISASPKEAERSEKARGHNTDMDVTGESHSSIVPKKPANKGRVPRPAESVEGRGLTKENTEQSLLDRTQCRNSHGTPFVARSRGLLGVREAARRDKKQKFTSLLHHLTADRLRASFFEQKKQAAPGIDGETWGEYAIEFERRIDDLHDRIHRGAYRAKPSKRIYIPKLDGGMRPLGIAALEDKIVQQAARTVLECIYEQDFLGFSYGYRPGRDSHQALDALFVGISKRKVNWIIDADIRSFYDNISHEWLMRFVEHRIADPRMLRLLKKWLRAGVSEDGEWSPTKIGTPQGAVISPLFANVFLHYVLDLWIEDWRKRQAKREVIAAASRRPSEGWRVAAKCVSGLVSVLCCPRQLRTPAAVPQCDPSYVAAHPTATQPTRPPLDLGKVLAALQTLATDTEDPPPLSQREVCMSTSTVRTVCGSSARTDLCGGRSAMTVPTAING